jgi:AcrR family transcriptional regulator
MAVPAPIALTAVSGIKRRADAERSIAAILDAAVAVLGERPEASMSEIARAAGVSRQTVYAHYPSREALLKAVAERALRRTLAAIEAAEPEHGPPLPALERLITAWWGSVAYHARVLDALAGAYPRHDAVHDFHEPILRHVVALAARGQHSRDFDTGVPPTWLAAAFLGLMHTAAEEVAAGRLDEQAAGRALQRSIPRLFSP